MKSSSSRKVLLVGLPPGFIDDLPHEDQQVLLDAVGKSAIFEWLREGGRAELEFSDGQGVRHFIYVDRQFIFRWFDGRSLNWRFRPTTNDDLQNEFF